MKLDLHTHCLEAVAFARPTVEVAEKIVAAIKFQGLDGIAITEHNNKEFGFRVRELVEHSLNNEVIIIPGWEVEVGEVNIVELFLPNDTIFRFLAHPGYPGDFADSYHMVAGIEIENSGHNWHMDKQKIRQFAEKYGLLLLSNSDAHYLDDIGKFYNDISLEQLARASRWKASSSWEGLS